MPPLTVTAEAAAAAAADADARHAVTAHDDLDAVTEELAMTTPATEPAAEPPALAAAPQQPVPEPPVAELAAATLNETDLAAPPEPPATTDPTPFAALARPPPPPEDDAAPAIPRWAFLRVGRAMERSAVADADDDVSYLDVELDPGASPRARGFFSAAPPLVSPRARGFFSAAPPPLADTATPPPPLHEDPGQLVVPGMPRGISAGSLAHSEGSYVDVHMASSSSSSHGMSPRSQSSGRSEDI